MINIMNHNSNRPAASLDTHKEVMAHLKLVLSQRPLSVDQKIQVLRDLMASELGGGNVLFYDCCQEMITQLHRLTHVASAPLVPGMNAGNFLADPLVLETLTTEYLETVAGRNIAFRVSCIEELGRAGRFDILQRHVGHVHHWKEGQALLKTLLYVATSDQIFEVLLKFIHARFSNEGFGRFGADVYREESIDGLVNAVVARSDLTMLRRLSEEFRRGNRLMQLHPEQLDRYDSQITAALVASEVRKDLTGLIRLPGTSSHPGHAESSAFPILDLSVSHLGRPLMTPVAGETPAAGTPQHEPTRVLPRPAGLTPPSGSALNTPFDDLFTGSLPPLPPRGSYADDESSGFVPEDMEGGAIGE